MCIKQIVVEADSRDQLSATLKDQLTDEDGNWRLGEFEQDGEATIHIAEVQQQPAAEPLTAPLATPLKVRALCEAKRRLDERAVALLPMCTGLALMKMQVFGAMFLQ